MAQFAQALISKLTSLQQLRAEPVPGPDATPQQLTDYAKRQHEHQYRINHLGKTLIGVLKRLPSRDRLQFHIDNVSDEQEKNYPLEEYLRDLNDSSGRRLLSGTLVGSSLEDMLLKLEALMLKNGMKLDEEAGKLELPYLPDDPRAPADTRVVQEHGEELKKLEQSISPDDPQAQEKRELLNRAGQILRSPSNEYLEYVGKIYTGTDSASKFCLEDELDRRASQDLYRYIQDQPEQGLPFKEKLPTTQSMHNTLRYDPNRMNLDAGLTPEDRNAMRALPSPFSPAMKERLTELLRIMGQIGSGSFGQSEACIQIMDAGGKPKLFFNPEQSAKYYGLIPLVQAKTALGTALASGDWNQIRSACQTCEEIRRQTDRMMDLVAPGWAPIFPANLESTRPKLGEPNRMPVEYLDRFVDHSRLNAMQLVYGFTQNTGVSTAELLDKPVQAIEDAGKRYVAEQGLRAETNIGAKLFRGLSDSMNLQFVVDWQKNNMLLYRASGAFAGMAASKEEGERIQTALLTGGSLALYGVREEARRWEQLTKLNREKRAALYGLAALLPEEDLDLSVLSKTLNSPHWKQATDPALVIKSLREQNKLDLNVLAQRTKTVLEQAEAEAKLRGTGHKSAFRADEYTEQALRVYDLVAATATPEERNSPGYQALKQSVQSIRNAAWKKKITETRSVGDSLNKLTSSLSSLRKKKEGGVFLSSKDSPEHQRMVRSLDRLQYKIKQLRNKASDEISLSKLSDQEKTSLRSLRLDTELRRARNDAYEYYRLKTENGTKSSFTYTAGEQRAAKALNVLGTLDKLGKDLGLTDPVDQLTDRTQLELLQNRSDPDWLEENCADCAARMIYAMSVGFKKLGPEEEARLMQENNVNRAVERIKEDPAFQRMVQNEDPKRLADMVIEGKGKLTDAYVKAANALKPAAERVRPKTVEEKAELWKQHEMPTL